MPVTAYCYIRHWQTRAIEATSGLSADFAISLFRNISQHYYCRCSMLFSSECLSTRCRWPRTDCCGTAALQQWVALPGRAKKGNSKFREGVWLQPSCRELFSTPLAGGTGRASFHPCRAALAQRVFSLSPSCGIFHVLRHGILHTFEAIVAQPV